jgi:hypothetical protein
MYKNHIGHIIIQANMPEDKMTASGCLQVLPAAGFLWNTAYRPAHGRHFPGLTAISRKANIASTDDDETRAGKITL